MNIDTRCLLKGAGLRCPKRDSLRTSISERNDSTERQKVNCMWLVSLALLEPTIVYRALTTRTFLRFVAMLTHSVAELWKVYRLMVFNYLIGNKDDHAKNFAFIHRDGDWHFAPAYDLLQAMASMVFARLQSMTVSNRRKKICLQWR